MSQNEISWDIGYIFLLQNIKTNQILYLGNEKSKISYFTNFIDYRLMWRRLSLNKTKKSSTRR